MNSESMFAIREVQEPNRTDVDEQNAYKPDPDDGGYDNPKRYPTGESMLLQA